MRTTLVFSAFCAVANIAMAQEIDIAKYDPNMAVACVTVTNGLKWIDGRLLPIEGRAFDDVDHWYDRLPSDITTNVNPGVRSMKCHTTGMQFRFATNSRRLVFRWVPLSSNLCEDHMPASGMSGIDVYRFDKKAGRWEYVKTGRIKDAEKGGILEIGWMPGTPCLVNLPLYNGIREFSLGVDPAAKVDGLPPHKSGISKPVVFYGTSITQGGCASRPGMAFVNIVGRDLDVPVVNLGFSGSGVMEFEMSDFLARIDASCYVLDCLWNMGTVTGERSNSAHGAIKGRNVEENYEPFIRNLRAKRPNTPIVIVEQCDVHCGGANAKDRYIKVLYENLLEEGWKDLVYLPKEGMYPTDNEGTVDGCHPNDYGMMSLSKAFGAAVRKALASELKTIKWCETDLESVAAIAACVVGADAVQSDAARMGAEMMNPGAGLACLERKCDGQFRVLVYGNSIALHAPKADIGWTNNWGMAASAREKDFAHLVVSGLEAKLGKKADFRIRNLAALERNFTTNIATVAEISDDAAWKPDYVVVAIGENVKGVDETNATAYGKFLADIARPFADSGSRVVMRSPFWKNDVKASCTKDAALEVGAAYVDAGHLGANEANKAIGLFSHSGVANHPGDLGMRRLAELILAGFRSAK